MIYTCVYIYIYVNDSNNNNSSSSSIQYHANDSNTMLAIFYPPLK